MVDRNNSHWSVIGILEKELNHRKNLLRDYRDHKQEYEYTEKVIRSINRTIELLENDKDFEK